MPPFLGFVDHFLSSLRAFVSQGSSVYSSVLANLCCVFKESPHQLSGRQVSGKDAEPFLGIVWELFLRWAGVFSTRQFARSGRLAKLTLLVVGLGSQSLNSGKPWRPPPPTATINTTISKGARRRRDLGLAAMTTIAAKAAIAIMDGKAHTRYRSTSTSSSNHPIDMPTTVMTILSKVRCRQQAAAAARATMPTSAAAAAASAAVVVRQRQVMMIRVVSIGI